MANNETITLNALRSQLPVGSRAVFVALEKELSRYYVVSAAPEKIAYRLYQAGNDLHLSEIKLYSYEMRLGSNHFSFIDLHQPKEEPRMRTLLFDDAIASIYVQGLEQSDRGIMEPKYITSPLERLL